MKLQNLSANIDRLHTRANHVRDVIKEALHESKTIEDALVLIRQNMRNIDFPAVVTSEDWEGELVDSIYSETASRKDLDISNFRLCIPIASHIRFLNIYVSEAE